jgi:phosphatase NudJ
MANIKLNSKNKINTANHSHGVEQFKPNTTVAAVIHHQGRFLLVEELEKGKTVYNQPAGHLEEKEDLIAAIKREIVEETGLTLTPDYLCGIYYFHRPDLSLYFLRFCFVIELDSQPIGQPQDEEIIANHWLSFDEIKAKKAQLRSTMVIECIEDYLSGQRSGDKIELSSLKSNL